LALDRGEEIPPLKKPEAGAFKQGMKGDFVIFFVYTNNANLLVIKNKERDVA